MMNFLVYIELDPKLFLILMPSSSSLTVSKLLRSYSFGMKSK